MNSQHRMTQVLYWFGPPLWCNTLLQCGGGGLPLGLMMNNTREERPPEVEAFLCSVTLCVWGGLSSSRLDEVIPPPLWWLVLFIEALVLFRNIEREGIQQQPF